MKTFKPGDRVTNSIMGPATVICAIPGVMYLVVEVDTPWTGTGRYSIKKDIQMILAKYCKPIPFPIYLDDLC